MSTENNTTKQKLSLMQIMDCVAEGFMNSKNVINVFAGVGNEFLRFQAALSNKSDSSSDCAIIFRAGIDKGYPAYESKDTLHKILFELSGIHEGSEVGSISVEMSPVHLLMMLAACDTIMQNRYKSDWFSSSSILNAFDLNGDIDFERLCSPLADVAGSNIIDSFADTEIKELLEEMVDEDILVSDTEDDVVLYTFSTDYRDILGIFGDIKNRLAIYDYKEDGQSGISYIISNDTNTWLFSIRDNTGKIESLNEDGFKHLANTLFTEKQKGSSYNEKATEKFCTNCGSKISAGGKYCRNCGSQVLNHI